MKSVTEKVQKDLPIKKANTMTSLIDLERGSFISLHKSSPQVSFITFMLRVEQLKANVFLFITSHRC